MKHANSCRQFAIFCNVPLLAGIGRVLLARGLYKVIILACESAVTINYPETGAAVKEWLLSLISPASSLTSSFSPVWIWAGPGGTNLANINIVIFLG